MFGSILNTRLYLSITCTCKGSSVANESHCHSVTADPRIIRNWKLWSCVWGILMGLKINLRTGQIQTKLVRWKGNFVEQIKKKDSSQIVRIKYIQGEKSTILTEVN